ncbi:hypothetical protein Tco_0726404 [Tanacetum coccineum]|uniref:Uncharacterized protein n=1 Tax=Tanacetum coccineum TaxID=301880 RepID=A0ABQ4YH46_9ASTR
MVSFLPLIEELVRAAGSDVTTDQLVVLFEREIAEDVGKIEEFRKLCIELRKICGNVELDKFMFPNEAMAFL